MNVDPNTVMDVDDGKTEVTDPSPADWDTTGILAANQAMFADKPIRVYLEETVLPVLRDGLKQVVAKRPADPCAYLGHFLLQHQQVTKEIKRESAEPSNPEGPQPSS
ncbi:Protein dpy-30 [Dispira simplex]|nr:Protein dpy-30 [Dispira simplex]